MQNATMTAEVLTVVTISRSPRHLRNRTNFTMCAALVERCLIRSRVLVLDGDLAVSLNQLDKIRRKTRNRSDSHSLYSSHKESVLIISEIWTRNIRGGDP